MIIKPKGPVWTTPILSPDGKPDVFGKFVLVALAVYADDYGACYMSQKALSEHTGMALRSVIDRLATLEATGHITRFPTYRPEDGAQGVDVIIVHVGQPGADRIELYELAKASAFRANVRLRIPTVRGADGDGSQKPSDLAPRAGGQASQRAAKSAPRAGGSKVAHVRPTTSQSAPGAGQEHLEEHLEESKSLPPLSPKEPSQIDLIWALLPGGQDVPHDIRKRSQSKKIIGKALAEVLKEGHAFDRVLAGVRAYYAEPDNAKDGYRWAAGCQRVLANGTWETYAPPLDPTLDDDDEADGASYLFGGEPKAPAEVFRFGDEIVTADDPRSTGISERQQRMWMDEWVVAEHSWRYERGPRPGQPGCKVHPSIQAEYRARAATDAA